MTHGVRHAICEWNTQSEDAAQDEDEDGDGEEDDDDEDEECRYRKKTSCYMECGLRFSYDTLKVAQGECAIPFRYDTLDVSHGECHKVFL